MDKQQIREAIKKKQSEILSVQKDIIDAVTDKLTLIENKFMYNASEYNHERMHNDIVMLELRNKRRTINREITSLQQELGDINERERAERQKDWNTQFVNTARNVLDDKQFDTIIRLTNEAVQQYES